MLPAHSGSGAVTSLTKVDVRIERGLHEFLGRTVAGATGARDGARGHLGAGRFAAARTGGAAVSQAIRGIDRHRGARAAEGEVRVGGASVEQQLVLELAGRNQIAAAEAPGVV